MKSGKSGCCYADNSKNCKDNEYFCYNGFIGYGSAAGGVALMMFSAAGTVDAVASATSAELTGRIKFSATVTSFKIVSFYHFHDSKEVHVLQLRLCANFCCCLPEHVRAMQLTTGFVPVISILFSLFQLREIGDVLCLFVQLLIR